MIALFEAFASPWAGWILFAVVAAIIVTLGGAVGYERAAIKGVPW